MGVSHFSQVALDRAKDGNHFVKKEEIRATLISRADLSHGMAS
jgi:hypothetical protein